MLSDHRAVYDAKCGRPQRGDEELIKCGHLWTGGGGIKRGHFLRMSFLDDPLMGILEFV